MPETTLRPAGGNGHMPGAPLAAMPHRRTPFDDRDPAPAERDPDYDKWAAYWEQMAQEALGFVADAFDWVAKSLAAGEASGAVDVVVFCAEESRGGMGIVTALHNLLATHYREHQIADEARAGVGMNELVKMASTTVAP